MTWGQIRLQLQIAGAGVSLDLLDEFLNSRYGQVLESTDWQGLQYHGAITTQAAYQSGTDTVTLTTGSASVAGSGTAWTLAITGLRFYRPGDTSVYMVTYVGAGALTLDRPYEGIGSEAAGTVYPGSAYVLYQNLYPLPADARAPVTILDPITSLPIQEMSKSELDATAGVRTLVGEPKIFAVYGDSSETTLPVAHQIELYPPPLHARAFPLNYLHAAIGFSGSNTTAAPLPWVSSTVLLYGCRADIEAHLAGVSENPGPHLALAKLYETKFQEELARLLRVEFQQRRSPAKIGMADRFTRHRMARASRGIAWRGGTPGGPN